MTGREVAPIAFGLGAGALGLWWFTRKAQAASAPTPPSETGSPTAAPVETATAPPSPSGSELPTAAPAATAQAPSTGAVAPATSAMTATPTTAPASPPAALPPWLVASVNAAIAAPSTAATAAPGSTAAPEPVIVATESAQPVRWIYPLPSWKGRPPVISNGFGAPRDGGARTHAGADIMYRRASRDELIAEFPPTPPHSPLYFMPADTPVLAVADGVLWSAGFGAKGGEVVIDHGAPWATEYLHLAKLYVAREARRSRGIRIRAGQALGTVGADPTWVGPAHLHFEIWRNGARARAAIDPAPLLGRARVIDAPLVVGSEQAPAIAPPAHDRAALDATFRQYGRGLPLAYLRALGMAESGLTPDHPMGVLNITGVALDEYNRHNLAVARGHLIRPEVATTVGAWILRAVIDSYRAHHPEVPTLREDWGSRDFVELLTAGWNAGASEARGVGRVARYLAAHRLPVTLETVWGHAAAAGAAATLSDPAKFAFARKVADHHLRLRAAGVA